MQVHRQQCQGCGSFQARNLIVREGDQPTRVYVRCAECEQLVARYELSGYYHHGKGLESYLRGQGAAAGDSGRQWLDEFRRTQAEAEAGYGAALDQLAADDKPI